MPKRKSPNSPSPKSAGEARRRRLTLSKIESDDLLTEILLHLPIKSLIRFKSVSKKWHSLISSDYFCHRHHLRHPKPQPSLILDKHNRLSYFNPAIKHQEMNKLPPFTLSVPHHQILQRTHAAEIEGARKQLPRLQSGHEAIQGDHPPPQPRLPQRGRAPPSVRPLEIATLRDRCVRTTSAFENRYMEEQPYKIDVYDSESRSWRRAMKAFMYSASFFSTDWMHWDGEHGNNAIYRTSGDTTTLTSPRMRSK